MIRYLAIILIPRYRGFADGLAVSLKVINSGFYPRMTNRGESALLDSSTLFFFYLPALLEFTMSQFLQNILRIARMTEEPNVSHLAGDSVMILIDAREL